MRRDRLFSAACSVMVTVGLANISLGDGVQGAREIITRLDSPRGIAVVLEDADLALELARQSELVVYLQSASSEVVTEARRSADAAGLLGTRLVAEQGPPDHIHLANNLADVVVDAAGTSPEAAISRVLRPGGTGVHGGRQSVKPFPNESDVWSHPYHGPDNNPQSRDGLVRRPFMTHFAAEPWYAAMPQQSVIAGGRMFKAYGHRTSALPQVPMLHSLVAFNAFNGVQLWRRELTPGFEIHRNTLIATADVLYIADDVSCKRLDAATGKVLDEIVAPSELCDGPVWKWMALQDGVLYAMIGENEPDVETIRETRFRGAGWPWWKIPNYSMQFGKTILAFDVKSKQVIWHYRQDEPIDGRSVCMASGRIMFMSPGKSVSAIDQKSGQRFWQNSAPELLQAIGEDLPAQDAYDGFVTTAYAKCSDKMLYFAGPARKNLVAIAADTGKLAWYKEHGNSQLVLRDEGLYVLGRGRRNAAMTSLRVHPISGDVLATFPSRDRCTRATGCVDTIFTRGGQGGSTSMFDVTRDEPQMGIVSPMRPACQDGVLIAHGQLYWGPWICRCDATQIGMMSLEPAGDIDVQPQATNADRLARETAASPASPTLQVTEHDWPTYRKDNARSAQSNLAVPKNVQRLWESKGMTTPAVVTSPVTVGNRAFVADTAGVVRALDSQSGTEIWRTYTGGPIRYSPAVAHGNLYVGAGDGWVYCLRADTGKTVWRFRGAPVERKVPIFGLLQSTWPIGSGVLVDGDRVYAAAGMFNYDGVHVYALDAATGEIRWQNNNSAGVTSEGARGPGVQGHWLLHKEKNLLCMAGGNTAPVAIYDAASGSYVGKGGTVTGKDLFIVGDSIGSNGHPLYWRQEDWHIIVGLELPLGDRRLSVVTDQMQLVDPAQLENEKPKPIWTAKPFDENHAVVLAPNAILVAGLHRDPDQVTQTNAGLVAIDPADGHVIWKQPLSADPVAFGIAIDRKGQILVGMQDGQVACFGPDS